MNLAETLREQVRARPGAAALIDPCGWRTRVTTFAELDRWGGRAARLLERHGLRPGDAVLVLQPMSAELYVVLLALFRLGLVAMFLDPSAGRAHVERCCLLHPPRALIASTRAHLLRLLIPALRRIPLSFVIGWPVPGAVRWSAAERLSPLDSIHPCPPETPALLTFTSGSTGQPKAVVRSHGFLAAQHRALVAALDLSAGQVDLATLPVFTLANLGSGVTSLIPNADLRYPGFIHAGPVVRQVLEHRADRCVASPAFLDCLARHCAERRLTLPSLTRIDTGGAPVFPRLLDQVQAMAPNARVIALYGSTEAEPIAHIGRHEMTAEDGKAMQGGRGLLTGKPVDSLRLSIVHDRWGTPLGPFTEAAFQGTRCRAGEPGEIVVSGGHVLPGYLNGQGDEETKFRVDGVVWHRTGDAGFLDDGGRLWLLGRCAARIRDGRGELYPFAVETAALQDARVRRAALIGYRGHRLLAVEGFPGVALDTAALRAALAWANLDEVRVCQRIPVDSRHNAKVDYPALVRMLDRMTTCRSGGSPAASLAPPSAQGHPTGNESDTTAEEERAGP